MAPAQGEAVEPGERSVLDGTRPRERPVAGKEAADVILTYRVAVPAERARGN